MVAESRRKVVSWHPGFAINCKGVGRGGGGARGGQAPPPNNLRGGANIPFGPPNNPPTFSFNFYVKQEKIKNVPN